ncbi:unnamed protein product [Rotaria sp. Silwood2]|nr:unnamed protein product [Rotaria sp. Silwood2]CAF4379250.1 unnamed protein product [Rotaria sp. Silwood2]
MINFKTLQCKQELMKAWSNNEKIALYLRLRFEKARYLATEEIQLVSSSPTSPTSLTSSSASSSLLHFNASNSSVVTSPTSNSCKNDIGLYIGKPPSDEQKYELLTCHFEPDNEFIWPYKERLIITGEKTITEKRYLKQSHLNEFKWLKYSPSQKGLFCIACVRFTVSTTRVSSYGKLVEIPLDDYKHLLGKHGDLILHQKTNYHLDCMVKMENFLYIYSKKPEASVELLMDKRLQKEIAENRARLKPIIETILLCGRQNFPLRGHRDDGDVLTNNDSSSKEGNFRALLRYRIEGGDTALKCHLGTCNKNASYVSKTAQNELISIIGNLILKQVIEEVKSAQFYSILLDETGN